MLTKSLKIIYNSLKSLKCIGYKNNLKHNIEEKLKTEKKDS